MSNTNALEFLSQGNSIFLFISGPSDQNPHEYQFHLVLARILIEQSGSKQKCSVILEDVGLTNLELKQPETERA